MQVIKLPSRCDRAAAEALYPDLLDVPADTAAKVDAGDVEHIGQAMLQLLAATAQSGGGVELSESSAEFGKAVALAKLEEVLSVGETA
ncbi:STAS domain-containing protein [Erythrobacter sp. W53]|uniref:STAS domain-containing protein n=1 Tax=Erythrobacter sp. W53 TaxID=3425947 RepID=UPI003D768B1F